MSYFHWIAGCTLGLALWLWRLVDAAFGVPKIADISRPEWDRKPALSWGRCSWWHPAGQHHRSSLQRSSGHRGDADSIALSRLRQLEVIA